MYHARLRCGHSIQIHIPGKLSRSRQGSIHLQIGSPTVITDDEADFLKREIEHGSLKDYSIILEPVPSPVALPSFTMLEPAPVSSRSDEKEAKQAPAPEPAPEPMPQPVSQLAEVVAIPGTITDEKEHESKRPVVNGRSKRRRF
jgi:hypothetical protein